MLAEGPRSYSNINLDMVAGVELRGIPPIICLDRDKLLISRKSIGPYEIYTSKRLSAGNVSHTLVTKRIKEYLRLCPFAERGLKIDFVHAGDGDFAFRVLKDVLKDEDKVHIDVHLYGEEGDTDLGEVFDRESYDRTDVTERFFMRNSNEFLPRLVYLKSCRNPKELSEGKVHLSILSNLKVSEVDAVGLGETYARTYRDADNSTLFDMDIFSSRYEIVNPEDAQPRRTYLVAPDDWLAMHYQQCCVWAERGTPACGVRAYVTEADLAKAEDLIIALHKRSDWVVIFDESIYREYLERPLQTGGQVC